MEIYTHVYNIVGSIQMLFLNNLKSRLAPVLLKLARNLGSMGYLCHENCIDSCPWVVTVQKSGIGLQ